MSHIREFFGLFGFCAHAKTTWPRTDASGTYVTCLDCGKSAAYDWANMRIYDPAKGPR